MVYMVSLRTYPFGFTFPENEQEGFGHLKKTVSLFLSSLMWLSS